MVKSGHLGNTGKRILLWLLLITTLLGIGEISFYLVYKYVPPDGKARDEAIFMYRHHLENTEKYIFDTALRLIGPKPGEVIINPQPEYVDRMKAVSINKMGIGFFDDGLDPGKKLVALALGDSFTRGMGSTDVVKYGWVELAENALRNIDIINMGNSGSGTKQQFRFYQRVKDYVDHNLVILNFYTGNDFRDNLNPVDFNDMIAALPQNVDKTAFLQKLLRMRAEMNLPLEFLAFSPIKSYLAWGILTALNKVIKFERFQYQDIREWEEKYIQRLSGGEEVNRLKTLRREVVIEARSRCLPTSGFCITFNNRIHNRANLAWIHRLAQHSARIVNKFFSSIRSAKKNFLLVIHPSKAEIYYPRFESMKKDYDFDLLRTVFKSLLNKNIEVLDLSKRLRKTAEMEKAFLYHKEDPHYNKAGYFAVGRIIAEHLRRFDHP